MKPAVATPYPESSILDARVNRHFGGGDLVVDLGCGDGAWIDSVKSRYARAIGIDISDGARTSRGGSIDSWEFIQRDLNEGPLPLPDGCADGVRANQVIEHVANPLHFVAEACRVLRPGGVFVASTPNIRYLRHIMRLVLKGYGPMTSGAALRTAQVWDDGHIHFFTARDLEWLARNAGFSRVHSEALISPTGKGSCARRALDKIRSREIIKSFLSGNVMVVAWK
jgi:SAM-dependent methyltransferase